MDLTQHTDTILVTGIPITTLDKVPKLKLLTYTKLLFAIKTLERAGDHICNIAEEIHFIVTGEDISTTKKPSQSIEKSLEGINK